MLAWGMNNCLKYGSGAKREMFSISESLRKFQRKTWKITDDYGNILFWIQHLSHFSLQSRLSESILDLLPNSNSNASLKNCNPHLISKIFLRYGNCEIPNFFCIQLRKFRLDIFGKSLWFTSENVLFNYEYPYIHLKGIS